MLYCCDVDGLVLKLVSFDDECETTTFVGPSILERIGVRISALLRMTPVERRMNGSERAGQLHQRDCKKSASTVMVWMIRMCEFGSTAKEARYPLICVSSFLRLDSGGF